MTNSQLRDFYCDFINEFLYPHQMANSRNIEYSECVANIEKGKAIYLTELGREANGLSAIGIHEFKKLAA